jgi:hypothetical protein
MGLEGKMTETTAGEELSWFLYETIKTLGKYPHAELVSSNAEPKQTTRMMKCECPGCGCVIRMTRKWLEEAGCPTCACGEEMKQEEKEEKE